MSLALVCVAVTMLSTVVAQPATLPGAGENRNYATVCQLVYRFPVGYAFGESLFLLVLYLCVA